MNHFIADTALFTEASTAEIGPLTAHVVDEDFFFILEAEGDVTKEQIDKTREGIRDEIQKTKPQTLSDFEDCITPYLKLLENLSFGFSGGLLLQDILYLKTVGTGRILISRSGKLQEIIEGDNKASGKLFDGDIAIFTTRRILEVLPHEELENQMLGGGPKDIVERLKTIANEKNSAVALFTQFAKKEAETPLVSESANDEMVVDKSITETAPTDESAPVLSTEPSGIMVRIGGLLAKLSKTKKTTFVIVVILFIILVWSVGLGHQRRQANARKVKIIAVEKLVTEKLQQAETESVVNIESAIALVDEARKSVANVSIETEGKEADTIAKLNQQIVDTKNKITKKQQVGSQIFWELSLAKKGARADGLYRDGDRLALLDKQSGEVYLLSIEKKSVTTIEDKEFDDGIAAASFDDNIFILKEDGVYKGTTDKKPEKIIEEDGWGQIADITIYNGNIYLLDREKDEIYKYLVAEEGYSSKTSYFKDGQSRDLANATAMTVDGSLFIAVDDTAFKYTSGLRDGFSLSLPQKGLAFTSIFTSKDVNQVYFLDPKAGKVIVAAKNGQYIKQIEAGVLKGAQDMVVTEGDKFLLVLKGDKLYSIAL